MKKIIFGLMWILILAVTSVYAFSPSFNCKQARAYVEKRVCVEKELAQLDNELADVFNHTLSRLSSTDTTILKKDESKWVTKRNNVCDLQSDSCIKRFYKDRIAFLQKYTVENREAYTESSQKNKYLTNKFMRADIKYKVLDGKVRLSVRVKNNYRNAQGGLSISFPQLKDDDRIIKKTEYGFSTLNAYNSNSKLWSGKYKRKFYSDYLLVEGWNEKWNKENTKEVSLEIDTRNMDKLVVNIRSVL